MSDIYGMYRQLTFDFKGLFCKNLMHSSKKRLGYLEAGHKLKT